MGVSQPLSEKVIRERFAALKCELNKGQVSNLPYCYLETIIMSIKIYEVDASYVSYLSQFAEHLFHNKKPEQQNSRKYIGVLITVHSVNYFAPLSSFKPKHHQMSESVDFLKIKNYAVININNMFPVPEGMYSTVDFSKEKNPKYKQLLQAEYRVIKSRQNLIRKNARIVYERKTDPNDHSSLSKRCNDFRLLEKKALSYHIK